MANLLQQLGLGGDDGSFGGSSGGGSVASSFFTNLLTGGAASLFSGLPSMLSKILGGLSCIGNQAFEKKDYEIRVTESADIINKIVASPSNLSLVKDRLNFLMYIIHRDSYTLKRLSSSCSKQWCQKTIDSCKKIEEQIAPYYTFTRYFKSYNDVNVGQIDVQEYEVTGYNGGLTAGVITVPDNPTYTPPVTNPTVNPPVTNPTVNQPVTNPTVNQPDLTPIIEVVKELNGSTTTYQNNDSSGTTTVSNYNPLTGQTTQQTIQKTDFQAGGYYDTKTGKWVFTASSGQTQIEKNMPYILGAAGLLGLLLISKKRK